jgi:hypothetical protein
MTYGGDKSVGLPIQQQCNAGNNLGAHADTGGRLSSRLPNVADGSHSAIRFGRAARQLHIEKTFGMAIPNSCWGATW